MLARAGGRGGAGAAKAASGGGPTAAGGGVGSDRCAACRGRAERMNYPAYRRQGLPTTSSLVESLVGEFNARVKGKAKFWNRPGGAEAILQVRAALLSEDGRLERHFASRPGRPYRRRAA